LKGKFRVGDVLGGNSPVGKWLVVVFRVEVFWEGIFWNPMCIPPPERI